MWLAVEITGRLQGVCAYHKQRSHNPIHDNTESYLDPDCAFAEHTVQGLVLDLAQNWIHHHEQSNSCVQVSKLEKGTWADKGELLTDGHGHLDKLPFL
jgi:hypothetical protein